MRTSWKVVKGCPAVDYGLGRAGGLLRDGAAVPDHLVSLDGVPEVLGAAFLALPLSTRLVSKDESWCGLAEVGLTVSNGVVVYAPVLTLAGTPPRARKESAGVRDRPRLNSDGTSSEVDIVDTTGL